MSDNELPDDSEGDEDSVDLEQEILDLISELHCLDVENGSIESVESALAEIEIRMPLLRLFDVLNEGIDSFSQLEDAIEEKYSELDARKEIVEKREKYNKEIMSRAGGEKIVRADLDQEVEPSSTVKYTGADSDEDSFKDAGRSELQMDYDDDPGQKGAEERSGEMEPVFDSEEFFTDLDGEDSDDSLPDSSDNEGSSSDWDIGEPEDEFEFRIGCIAHEIGQQGDFEKSPIDDDKEKERDKWYEELFGKNVFERRNIILTPEQKEAIFEDCKLLRIMGVRDKRNAKRIKQCTKNIAAVLRQTKEHEGEKSAANASGANLTQAKENTQASFEPPPSSQRKSDEISPAEANPNVQTEEPSRKVSGFRWLFGKLGLLFAQFRRNKAPDQSISATVTNPESSGDYEASSESAKGVSKEKEQALEDKLIEIARQLAITPSMINYANKGYFQEMYSKIFRFYGFDLSQQQFNAIYDDCHALFMMPEREISKDKEYLMNIIKKIAKVIQNGSETPTSGGTEIKSNKEADSDDSGEDEELDEVEEVIEDDETSSPNPEQAKVSWYLWLGRKLGVVIDLLSAGFEKIRGRSDKSNTTDETTEAPIAPTDSENQPKSPPWLEKLIQLYKRYVEKLQRRKKNSGKAREQVPTDTQASRNVAATSNAENTTPPLSSNTNDQIPLGSPQSRQEQSPKSRGERLYDTVKSCTAAVWQWMKSNLNPYTPPPPPKTPDERWSRRRTVIATPDADAYKPLTKEEAIKKIEGGLSYMDDTQATIWRRVLGLSEPVKPHKIIDPTPKKEPETPPHSDKEKKPADEHPPVEDKKKPDSSDKPHK